VVQPIVSRRVCDQPRVLLRRPRFVEIVIVSDLFFDCGVCTPCGAWRCTLCCCTPTCASTSAFEWLIVTPRYHQLHHASDGAAIDKNFAVDLPWLDGVFGT
jgi:hypothetical protein